MSTSLFLDDLQIGQQWHGGPIEMTQADIVRFASEYDPQPMHIDTAAAASGRFGGIIASGWHVASVVMHAAVGARFKSNRTIITTTPRPGSTRWN